jgi:hypothetical protein
VDVVDLAADGIVEQEDAAIAAEFSRTTAERSDRHDCWNGIGEAGGRRPKEREDCGHSIILPQIEAKQSNQLKHVPHSGKCFSWFVKETVSKRDCGRFDLFGVAFENVP